MDNNFSNVVKKRNTAKIVTLLLFLAILVFLLALAFNYYTDYLEIKEVGTNFTDVYIKNITMQIGFQSISFCLIFILLFGNLLLVKRTLKKREIERGFLGNTVITCGFAVLISLFVGSLISGDLYEKFLLYINPTSFNIADPIFGVDVSFYVFKREFLQTIIQSLMSVWTIIIVLVVFTYLMLYIRLGERTLVDFVNDTTISAHIVINLVLYIILCAVLMFISAQNVLFSEFAADLTGCGFVEEKIWINYYRIMPFVLLILACIGIYFVKTGKIKKILKLVLTFATIFIITNVIAFLVNSFYVSPNEIAVEKQYIDNNIKFTKLAYNLDNVVETEYKYTDEGADSNNIDDNILKNLRIVDYQSTITSTNQLQTFKNYYQFKDMDVSIYDVDGLKKAVLTGARELEIDNLDKSAKNYLNQKFRYTHGYGITIASLNSVSANGEPEYLVKDMKNNSKIGDIQVKQPRIYFGELTSNNVIVNTKVGEIDYTEGTEDKIYDYTGTAGIKMNFINKLLFALKTGDFRMLVSSQIKPESKLLLNQNIIERLNLIAPFIKFDPDIHIIADDDGNLKWIADGYTYTDKFPYAQYTDGINYIRNSVKADVDAYNGTVKLYIIDESDPIATTYSKIYPTLFENSPMPESIKNKMKYPEWLFSIQSNIYAKYHVASPETFYNKNDLYTVASEKYSDDVKSIEPYYNILKLDEFSKTNAELVLMLPYTPYNRENMSAWIAVGNEGSNYGKFVAYAFPKDITVYGPLQIENMIDNNPEISKELTLWNSGGSKVIRGNLLAVPVNNSLLYIEPVYLSSENQASLPELKRVIAVYGNNVVMAENIVDAINKAMGVKIEQSNVSENTNSEQEDDILHITDYDELISIYERLETSSKDGEWKDFGEALADFKEYVNKIKENSINPLTNSEE